MAGKRPDRDRGIGRAEGGGAGLRDRPAGLLGHDGEAGEVRGLALVGRHAERGVALEMLHWPEALAGGELDILVGDVVLIIDEGLAPAA